MKKAIKCLVALASFVSAVAFAVPVEIRNETSFHATIVVAPEPKNSHVAPKPIATVTIPPRGSRVIDIPEEVIEWKRLSYRYTKKDGDNVPFDGWTNAWINEDKRGKYLRCF